MSSVKQLRKELINFVIDNNNLFNIRSINGIFDKINRGRKTTLEKLKEQFSQPTNKKITLTLIKENIKQETKQKDTQKLFIRNEDFNGLMNYLIQSKKPLKEDFFNSLFSKLLQGNKKNLIITDEFNKERILPINENNRDIIFNILTKLYTEMGNDEIGSDRFNDINLKKVINLQITDYKNPLSGQFLFTNLQKNGAYFKYENTTNEDLTKYQIYRKTDKKNKENCLIYTLQLCNIEEEKINKVKQFLIGGQHIKKTDIKNITDIIMKNIHLHTFNEKEQKQFIVKYGKYNDTIHVALYENHYFIYENTKYSKYSIDNYEELKNKENFYDIYKKNIFSKIERKIDSLKLIMLLHKQGLFIEKDESDEIEYKENKIENINLNYIHDEQDESIAKTSKQNTLKNVFYADTETFVDTGVHKLFLLGVIGSNSDNVYMLNINDYEDNEKYSKEQMLVYNFLNYITNFGNKNAIIYFHNLKYDHHILEPYLNIKSKCCKDGQFYNVVALYKKVNIEFRDSYKLAPFALSKFCGEFQLPNHLHKKEAIAYSFYNENIKNYTNTNIEDYKKHLPNDLHSIFNENIKPFLTGETTFNALQYYKEYLKYDCLVLKYGLLKFNEIITNLTDNKMNIFESLTISSLTDKYMYLEGAYDNVYQVKRNLRDYISRAVYGGRVCVNPLYEKKIVEGKTADYDGVSLYPSAIKRLCDELGGLPTGKCKRYKKDEFSNWVNNIYSIMTIKITKVNKNQQMPMIAIKGDITEYTNEPPSQNIVIDSITLQDYINFHKIEYEILDGVYWNETTNNKMGDVIKTLFNERIKHKKLGNNAIQNTLKLMLNSSYGKTILKKSETESVIKPNKYVESYLYQNFNTIKEVKKINEYQSEVVNFCADKSYNRCHIGVAILSMSKRIMNEVFDIANDNNIKIYYTDTDSIHMEYDKTPLLEQKYFEKYNKVLNGKGLGQFHNDFDLKNAVGDIYASKSIFLGKKSYIDYIQGKDENGNDVFGHHFRLKGITLDGLNYVVKKQFNNDPFKMYEYLAKSKKINFLLNPFDEDNNKQKVLFEFSCGSGVKTKDEFYREVCF
jgi:hypothetical protein